jgi:replicative DNA helicase
MKVKGRGGRTPPHNLEMERGLLCACLVDSAGAGRIVNVVKSESFYDNRHRLVFAAMERLEGRGQPVDILTVSDELRAASELEAAGGDGYLMGLSNEVATSANVEHYAGRVLQQSVLRRLITSASNIAGEAYDAHESEDLVQRAINDLDDIRVKLTAGKVVRFGDALDETLLTIAERRDGRAKPGLLTDVGDLDGTIGGLERGDLILVAARPSVGKSDLLVNILLSAAMRAERVLLFSVEMPRRAIIRRLVSLLTGIFRDRLRTAKGLSEIEFEAVVKTVDRLRNLPIVIHDESGITVPQMRSIAIAEHRRSPLSLVLVDYVQLITPHVDGNREREVSAISWGLKQIARSMDVPLVAAAQLNREVEKREHSREPLLADLRDTGSLEQDASVVLMLYAPWIYDPEGSKQGTDILVRKNRDGSIGRVEQVPYNRGTGRFGTPFAKWAGGNVELTSSPQIKEQGDDLPF